MKKLIAFVVSAHLLPISLYASQEQLDAELGQAMASWKASQQTVQDKDEFEQFKARHFQQYDKYIETHFAEFDAYRDDLILEWGDAQMSSRSQYVHYLKNSDARLLVDFEQDQLVVSVKHNMKRDVSKGQAQQIFKTFLQENSALLTEFFQHQSVKHQQNAIEKGSSYIVDNAKRATALVAAKAQIKTQTLQQQQLVEKQFDAVLADTDDTVSGPNALDDSKGNEAAEQLKAKKQAIEALQVKRIKKLKESIKSLPKMSGDTAITEFTIKLPKNTLAQKRASGYIKQIQAQSERFAIDNSLVLAVMHTESHFNPLAKSHIPAYGLMQVVPTSAGVDVNRFLYDIDEPMSGPYLYVTDNNIEAGTAYLHLLNDRYLRHIEDPLSRKYCTIAAYNTGAGNVARVFNSNGSRNIKQASKIINSMSPQLVLKTLQSDLPYDETKRYLDKVLSKETLYIQ
ncbi:membrane-bound lytic murein transglycosylase C [Pseudoalteromonas citrea]|uniref:Membrane-bound lytic murein transglycosylase C n=2 Tax=Pseudoalteromonas citrea TaxID=43655 RepID=A0AAD4AHT1_9GAMM|nr:transglycosylase SLT domain-containing protein [Pseudoalteromonas citrea]KAF7769968.1 membrane-bound lytic murein transglycosylase C [Pseudoalteromonas citrea]